VVQASERSISPAGVLPGGLRFLQATPFQQLLHPPRLDMNTSATQPTEDRVRQSSSAALNCERDTEIAERVARYAGQSEAMISRRISELEREWDIERALEVNASSLALLSLLLGTTVNRKWFLLTGVVASFLLQHGLQGWCPPLPILRRFGLRTQGEIDAEKAALKALRGDFDSLRPMRQPA
jgi:hypothetical protein